MIYSILWFLHSHKFSIWLKFHDMAAYSPAAWALMRLVEPLRPNGTPAVMTTTSPGYTSPSFRTTSVVREKIRSVELTSPVR